MSQTLYEKIGGAAAVSAVVADFYERLLDDPIVNGYFEDIDVQRLIGHQTNFVGKALGGPELYEGRDMARAHANLNITAQAFDVVAGHLQAALVEAGVGEGDTGEIIAVVASLKDQVVSGGSAQAS